MLVTAVPNSIWSELQSDWSGGIESMAAATTNPSWFTAMPTSAQAYWSSVGAAEQSIVNKDEQDPAPTHAVKVAGVVLAAGGAALVMI